VLTCHKFQVQPLSKPIWHRDFSFITLVTIQNKLHKFTAQASYCSSMLKFLNSKTWPSLNAKCNFLMSAQMQDADHNSGAQERSGPQFSPLSSSTTQGFFYFKEMEALLHPLHIRSSKWGKFSLSTGLTPPTFATDVWFIPNEL
jgi:hypothetical protein